MIDEKRMLLEDALDTADALLFSEALQFAALWNTYSELSDANTETEIRDMMAAVARSRARLTDVLANALDAAEMLEAYKQVN